MTDLPRGSFPLVVPPPGGFEEAVRRGRRIRRRRAGGSTGAALVLVGALAFSLTGGPNGTSGLEPARPIHDAQSTQGPYTSSESPQPSSTPADVAPSSSAEPGSGGNSYFPPPPVVPSVGVPVPGSTEVPAPAYAPRQPIVEGDPAAGTGTECLQEAASAPWCTIAYIDSDSSKSTYGTLKFTVCRSVNYGDDAIAFDRKQEAEFSIKSVATNEVIWTYSHGVPVEPSSQKTDVPAGWCVTWETRWNTYDDFGQLPDVGDYVLTASTTGTSQYAVPADTEQFSLTAN